MIQLDSTSGSAPYRVLRYPGVNIGNTFPEQLYRARYSHYYERLMQSFQKVGDMDKHQLTIRCYFGEGEMIPDTQSSRCYLNLGKIESREGKTISSSFQTDWITLEERYIIIILRQFAHSFL